MGQKLGKCYPPQFEIIPLLLVVLTFYITLSNYSVLPDTIPIDFNSEGVADDWANKNMIFLFPGLAAFSYIFFTFINIWFAVTKHPKALMNLPAKRKANLSDSQTEELRVVLNRYLFILKVLVDGLSVYILYSVIEVALGRANNLGVPFTLLIAATILVTVGLMVWKSFRITRVPNSTQK